MQKNSIEYKVMKTAFILFIGGLIIFAALAFINYSLLIGWIAGSLSAMLGYLIGILLINGFFKKEKSKTLGFWVGMGRFYINLLLQAGLFIAVIAIDKSVNGHSFIGGGIHDMYSPINLFTYIGGVSLIMISTLVAQFLSRKEGTHGTKDTA